MRRRRRYLLLLLALPAYLLVFPDLTSTEFGVDAVWAIEPDLSPIAPQVPGDAADSTLLPFVTDDHFGWVDASGVVHGRWRVSYAVAMTASHAVSYSQRPEQLVVVDRSGAFYASLPVVGYPFFIGENLFVVSPDGLRLTRLTLEGGILWSHEFRSIVTTIAATSQLVIVGTLGSGVVAIDSAGGVVPIRATEPAVPGFVSTIAADPHGELGAVVRAGVSVHDADDADAAADANDTGGVDSVLELLRLENGVLTPVLRRPIRPAADTPPAVAVYGGGNLAAFASASDGDGPDEPHVVEMLDLTRGALTSVAMDQPVRAIVPSPGSDLIFVSAGSRVRDPRHGFLFPSQFAVAAADGTVPIRQRFAAEAFEVSGVAQTTVLVIDDRMLAVRFPVQ